MGPLSVFTVSDLGTGDSYRRQSGWAGNDESVRVDDYVRAN
ncbi:hypothetical protein [Streptomyces sp. NPDC053720]